MKVYYNHSLKQKAGELRKKATFSERYLWKYLRSRQMMGYQFSRQKPIGKYIVDFYCSKLSLVIEIDGSSHDGKQTYDKKREEELKKIGLHILRFDGYYVVNNIEGTLEIISQKIEEIKKERNT